MFSFIVAQFGQPFILLQGMPAFCDFTIPIFVGFLKKIFIESIFGKISDFQLLWIAFQLYKVFAITQTLRIPI